MVAVRWFAMLAVGCLYGCVEDSNDRAVKQQANTAEEQAEEKQKAQRQTDREECRRLRHRLEQYPALAGTPRLDEQRHRVLGQAKGWPVVFRREPIRDEEELSPYFRAISEAYTDRRRSFSAFETLRGSVQHHRKQVRQILMPEGYLYADDPEVARWLVTHLDLRRLFNEPELWLMRGDEVFRLERTERGYRHADGANAGAAASLLLFDRVTTRRSELEPVLHVDFVRAAEQLGFDRVEIERLTSEGINARLRYGSDSLWVQAVFSEQQGRTQLVCEIIEEDRRQAVHDYREQQRIRQQAIEKLRQAMALQVREQLMFDEPKEEVGQQDGSLRPLWLWAYRHGGDGYSFNKIWYPVFDSENRPHPPQVCIDFVLDTYERASGTWFACRGKNRDRSMGSIDFERLDMPNRRSVEAVADYFREHPGMFGIWDLEAEKRIRFAQREAFYDFVRDHADYFRVGNVVLIHGPRGGEAHYHSAIVSRTDPMTGMPIELGENAGKPRLRSWHSVTQSGPLRSIRAVMIPEIPWLREAFSSKGSSVAWANDGVESVPSNDRDCAVTPN